MTRAEVIRLRGFDLANKKAPKWRGVSKRTAKGGGKHLGHAAIARQLAGPKVYPFVIPSSRI